MARQPSRLADAAIALRSGQLKTVELFEAAADYDRELQSYVEFEEATARPFAECADAAFAVGLDGGALHGIPVSVKDIFGLTGWATRAGSPRELPGPWNRDGLLMGLMRRQFAVFSGKTYCVEFAFGTNSHRANPRNPWDRERVCGGSSSGAAASLADGSCLLAMGTDTAGSVRVPASVTGVGGLKTTVDRWPTDGIVPLSRTLDTVGILARTAVDAWLAFNAIDDTASSQLEPPDFDGTLSGFKIGVPNCELWEDCSPGIVETVQKALGDLEKAGTKLLEFDFPEAGEAIELLRTGNIPATCFLSCELPEWLDDLPMRGSEAR